MGIYRINYTEYGQRCKEKLPKKFKRLHEDLEALDEYLSKTPTVPDQRTIYSEDFYVYKCRYGIATEKISKRSGLRFYYALHQKLPHIRLIACIYFKGDIDQLTNDQEKEVVVSARKCFRELLK